jgi:hypothetical protein
MLLSAVSVLVVAQPSSESTEGLTKYPVHILLVIEHNGDVSLKNESTGRLRTQFCGGGYFNEWDKSSVWRSSV